MRKISILALAVRQSLLNRAANTGFLRFRCSRTPNVRCAAVLENLCFRYGLATLVTTFIMIFPVWADVPAYTLVKEKSALKFFAIQNGAPLEGAFREFTTDIRFDAGHLDQSHINAEVNIGSVSVANDDVQKNITLSEWLSAAAFPKAAFKSKTISHTPNTDSFFAKGDLTLRGKTVPVTLNFDLKTTGNTSIATGFITLKRNDFGIGQGQWAKDDVIKNEVRVELRIVAEKK